MNFYYLLSISSTLSKESSDFRKTIVITRRALQITLLSPDVIIPLSEITFDVTE